MPSQAIRARWCRCALRPMAPSSKKLIQSSGNKAWDDAVLRALDKTESLPRDVDGRVPSTLEIGFRPQD
jgi:hypothetical protein